jgi:hypothetical protein
LEAKLLPRKTLQDVLGDVDDLGLLDVRSIAAVKSPAEVRAASGFEEINKFVDENLREPDTDHGAGPHEKRLGQRLASLRSNAELIDALIAGDRHDLLGRKAEENLGQPTHQSALSDPDLNVMDMRERLVGEHGAGTLVPAAEPYDHEPTSLEDVLDDDDLDIGGDLHDLRRVTPWAERDKPEYVARQSRCEDFEKFKPLFDLATQDIDVGRRKTREFKKGSEIQEGHMFIVRGMMAYVAERKGNFRDKKKNPNARLRVIFSNGTESGLLLRSFSSALYNDPNGRRITAPSDNPVFGGEPDERDIGTGTIYVLKSLSEVAEIKQHRAYLHKIGVTSGEVSRRIQGAENEPTFLMAPVEIVAGYKLYNVNRTRLEHLLHSYFDAARAGIEIKDRFGQKIRPREWFFVTVDVIREAVQRIEDGSLTRSHYDPDQGRIVEDDK